MNKILTIEDVELEALKQMSLEMALRLNVLQGHSLLEDSVTVLPNKRLSGKRKIWFGVLLITIVTASITATIFDQPIIFVIPGIMLIGEEIFTKRRSEK